MAGIVFYHRKKRPAAPPEEPQPTKEEREAQFESFTKQGVTHYKNGQYKEARKAFEKALPIVAGLFGKDVAHKDLAARYHNIGSTCKRLGEPEKALPYYQKALQMKEKTLPKDHDSTKRTKARLDEYNEEMAAKENK